MAALEEPFVEINEEDNGADGGQQDFDDDHVEDGSQWKPFKCGSKFDSIDQVYEEVKKYEELHYCQLWKRDARTLEAASKRVPKRVAKSNQSLVYYSVRYSCKFGGKEAKSRETEIRSSKSFRQNCPFDVVFTLSADGRTLDVVKSYTSHNHALSE